MRSEIINALRFREVATQRMTMEKWIGYEEESSLIPRGRRTPDKIKGSELRDTKTLTQITQFEYSHILIINGL